MRMRAFQGLWATGSSAHRFISAGPPTTSKAHRRRRLRTWKPRRPSSMDRRNARIGKRQRGRLGAAFSRRPGLAGRPEQPPRRAAEFNEGVRPSQHCTREFHRRVDRRQDVVKVQSRRAAGRRRAGLVGQPARTVGTLARRLFRTLRVQQIFAAASMAVVDEKCDARRCQSGEQHFKSKKPTAHRIANHECGSTLLSK
jgi:hypothetical protein